MSKSFTFRVPAEEIVGAVTRVTRTGKSSIEVLNGVHMALDGKELVVQTTDMSMILRERIPITHAGEGAAIALSADKVLKGLRTLDGTLTFTGKKDVLAIRNGETTLNYVLGNIEDYPTLPEGMGGGSALTCERREFELTFGTVKAALGKDQSRPVLTGIYLELDEGRVRMTTTDSYRLASDSCACSGADTFDGVIVAGADFGKALAFVKGENVTLSRFDRWVILSEGGRSAWLRVIDGQYPDYRKLIPQSFEGRIELDRRAALKAFDRMAKLNEGNLPAKLEIVDDHSILASLPHPDKLDVRLAESKINAEITGAYELGFSYGLNPGFMYDALAAIGGDTARFHYINPLRPCLLTEPDYDHLRQAMPDRFYLVMPVKLRS